MARFVPLVVVLVLLTGTAAMFGVTERLKLSRPPIGGPKITKVFSPVCECESEAATIAFRLREAGRLSLSVLDSDDDVVRELVSVRRPAGRFETAWDGRDERGKIVPDGSYRLRLRLSRDRRLIVLPDTIRIDTRAPSIELLDTSTDFVSPDGDGRNDGVRVRYRINERAKAILRVNGTQRVKTRFQPVQGSIAWFGLVDGNARPAGLYRLTLSAEDEAGNRAAGTKAAFVEISYVTLGRQSIRVRTRTRFGVRVTTDARLVTWRFAGGTGQAKPGLLVLRAPRPGRYTLFVTANGHAAKAQVRVVPRPGPRRPSR